jgi:chromosome segregation ATPase
VELQKRRDEAEDALAKATIAGTAEKKEHEEKVAGLMQMIKDLKEGRKEAEDEIEELKAREGELLKELHEERQKVSRLEVENEALERSNDIVAASAVTASVVGASSRRGSVGESERRRHGHGRRQSSGSSINFVLEASWHDDKEKKNKKKKGSRK